jgi:hypothetical protein
MSKDIRLSTSFFSHPKTIMLQARLGPTGVLSLVKLWCFAGEWKQSGDLSSMTPEEIAIAAQWPSGHETFISALIECKYLDENMKIHDWEVHNPWAFSAPERSIKARISALYKHGKDKEAEQLRKASKISAKRMRIALRQTEKRTAPSPSPSPSPSPRKRRVNSKTSIPNDFKISDRVKQWALKKGYRNLDEHLESFKLKALAKEYEYADWDAAFMNAIRDNWAKIKDDKKSPCDAAGQELKYV